MSLAQNEQNFSDYFCADYRAGSGLVQSGIQFDNIGRDKIDSVENAKEDFNILVNQPPDSGFPVPGRQEGSSTSRSKLRYTGRSAILLRNSFCTRESIALMFHSRASNRILFLSQREYLTELIDPIRLNRIPASLQSRDSSSYLRQLSLRSECASMCSINISGHYFDRLFYWKRECMFTSNTAWLGPVFQYFHSSFANFFQSRFYG